MKPAIIKKIGKEVFKKLAEYYSPTSKRLAALLLLPLLLLSSFE